jgi:hypothetical protein
MLNVLKFIFKPSTCEMHDSPFLTHQLKWLSYLLLDLRRCLFLLDFAAKILHTFLVSPLREIRHARPVADYIATIIGVLCKNHKLLSSSLCKFPCHTVFFLPLLLGTPGCARLYISQLWASVSFYLFTEKVHFLCYSHSPCCVLL